MASIRSLSAVKGHAIAQARLSVSRARIPYSPVKPHCTGIYTTSATGSLFPKMLRQHVDQFFRRRALKQRAAIYLAQLLMVSIVPYVIHRPGQCFCRCFRGHAGFDLDHSTNSAHLRFHRKAAASRLDCQAEYIVAGFVAPAAQFSYSALDRVYREPSSLVGLFLRGIGKIISWQCSSWWCIFVCCCRHLLRRSISQRHNNLRHLLH